MKKVAIVGYGSIGKRHFANFKELNCDTRIVSRRQHHDGVKSYLDIKTCFEDFSPEIFFICNETHLHSESLRLLKNLNFKGLVIVEKPISDCNSKIENLDDLFYKNVKVAYNLRFNPLLLKLKSELLNEKITSAVCYVGQYLPNWRRSVDYRESYSAYKDKGGGVLLDLSHEIDFCSWLFGPITGLFAQGGKLSDLAITSEDTASILTSHLRAESVTINLNYTDRITNRFLIVNTNNKTIKIDFIKKSVQINENEQILSFEANDSYIALAQNVLNENADKLTGFDDSIFIIKAIDLINESMNTKKWIKL